MPICTAKYSRAPWVVVVVTIRSLAESDLVWSAADRIAVGFVKVVKMMSHGAENRTWDCRLSTKELQ